MTKDEIIKNKADLQGAGLQEADLRGVDLQEANLRGANLRRANLRGANLRGANLWEADLRGASLWEADLREACLQEAGLQEADLQEADLRRADLRKANLRRADLRRADLQGANLWKANLRGANLQGANLWEANLWGVENISSQFQSDLNILRWQKSRLIAFKFLNGNFSPYQDFRYEIGEKYICENGSSDDRALCDIGINLASLEWCLRETNCNLSKTYAIFEFEPTDILSIPYNSDGKFRVKKATYIRNLTEDEIKEAIKPLYEND